MPTPQEQAEYDQYLRETGQAGPQAATNPAPSPRKSYKQMMDEVLATPEQITAGMNNALGGGAMGALGKLGKAIPKLAGGLGSMLEAGTLNAAQTPGDAGDKLKSFLLGGGIQGAGGVASKVLDSAGDLAMQLAVGAKKYGKGEGTALANEGVWGTRGMMKDKVNERLADSYEQTLKAASSPSMGAINARQIGNSVYDDIGGPLTGRGRLIPSEADRPVVDKAMEFADDIKSRGGETGTQALERRRNAGKRAYRESDGQGKTSVVGELSQSEQAGYSRALKDADPTGEITRNDARYTALKPAQRALKEKPSLSGMGIVSKPLTLVGGALPTSIAGQGLVKGGKLAEFLTPVARQGVVGGSRDPGPSAEELAEYEQYLRETGQSK